MFEHFLDMISKGRNIRDLKAPFSTAFESAFIMKHSETPRIDKIHTVLQR